MEAGPGADEMPGMILEAGLFGSGVLPVPVTGLDSGVRVRVEQVLRVPIAAIIVWHPRSANSARALGARDVTWRRWREGRHVTQVPPELV